MIINGTKLLQAAPIKNMLGTKETNGLVSHGLTESGYDIRIKQTIEYWPAGYETKVLSEEVLDHRGRLIAPMVRIYPDEEEKTIYREDYGTKFVLASSIEEFDMPDHLMGQVLNKSTWARKGLDSSMTTNIEPGWKGFLTLELVFHGNSPIIIPAGSGIAQVIFHELSEKRSYGGKYQNQPDKPVEAISL